MILGFNDPLFYLYLVYFFVALFLAFFVPGNLVLRKIKLPVFSRLTLSPIIGMVLWIYQGVIFGYLHCRWASYIYLAILFLAWVKFNKNELLKMNISLLKEKVKGSSIDKLSLAILVIGSFIQISTVWFQGYKNPLGFSFYSLFPDSFYNLALTSSIVRRFPPFEPGASNIVVHNYHYLSNLIIADLVRIFHLPLIQSSYQYLSIFFSVWLGLLALAFTREFNLNKSFGRWFIFLLYFSGDIIFLLFLILGKGFNFGIDLPEKATTLWVSPPRVFALIVLFSGIILLARWIKIRSLYTGFLMALVFASLIGLKVYIGIFALVGLGFLGCCFLLKREFSRLIPLVLALLVALVLYIPVNAQAGGLVFSGLWRIENFAVSQLGLEKLELARRIYLTHHNYIRVAIVELFYFALYLYSLAGMFLIGFIQSKKSLSRLPKELHIFLVSGLIISLICGLFFLQESGGANTTQFLFSLYFVGSIYTALSLSYLLNKLNNLSFRALIILIICILISARVIHDEFNNIDNISRHIGFADISNKELAAINYLKDNTKVNDIIMVDRRWSADNDCYSLVFISSKLFFLCGAGILNDHNVDIKSRENIETNIFTNTDPGLVKDELSKNNIAYIYLKQTDQFPSENKKDLFGQAYSNNLFEILKVK